MVRFSLKSGGAQSLLHYTQKGCAYFPESDTECQNVLRLKEYSTIIHNVKIVIRGTLGRKVYSSNNVRLQQENE